MKSTPPRARARSSPPKSAALAGSGSVHLRQRTHELHELPEALVRTEPQVLAKQAAVDVLLVCLDHRVGRHIRRTRTRILGHEANLAPLRRSVSLAGISR